MVSDIPRVAGLADGLIPFVYRQDAGGILPVGLERDAGCLEPWSAYLPLAARPGQEPLVGEMIPFPCWGSSLCAFMKPAAWSRLRSWRREILLADRCEICAAATPPLHLHELWSFMDAAEGPSVQRLAGFVLLCGSCHAMQHMGRAGARGVAFRAVLRMRLLWGVSAPVFHAWSAGLRARFEARSRRSWRVLVPAALAGDMRSGVRLCPAEDPAWVEMSGPM